MKTENTQQNLEGEVVQNAIEIHFSIDLTSVVIYQYLIENVELNRFAL